MPVIRAGVAVAVAAAAMAGWLRKGGLREVVTVCEIVPAERENRLVHPSTAREGYSMSFLTRWW